MTFLGTASPVTGRSPSLQLQVFHALPEFLDMVHFYDRFIPPAAWLILPLSVALKGKSGKQVVDWTV